LHPELKGKRQPSTAAEAHQAFHTTSHVIRKASVIGNGVDDGKRDLKH
jgi:hypothetical protein